MFGCEEKQSLHLIGLCERLRFGFSLQPEVDGVGTLSTGEEEVKVTKSEVPVSTGTWCKRETPRR